MYSLLLFYVILNCIYFADASRIREEVQSSSRLRQERYSFDSDRDLRILLKDRDLIVEFEDSASKRNEEKEVLSIRRIEISIGLLKI